MTTMDERGIEAIVGVAEEMLNTGRVSEPGSVAKVRAALVCLAGESETADICARAGV
jgi:hypothetical protein